MANLSQEQLRRLARLGAILWIVVLAGYHWNPFDFTLSRNQIATGLHQFLAVPFPFISNKRIALPPNTFSLSVADNAGIAFITSTVLGQVATASP